MDIPQRESRPNPISQANFFSRHFLVWFWPIFRLGYHKSLKEEDLWDPAPEDQARENLDKLESAWERHNDNNNITTTPSARISNGKGLVNGEHVELLVSPVPTSGSRSTNQGQDYKALTMALVETFGSQYFWVWPLLIFTDCGLKVIQPWFMLLLVRTFIVEPRDETAQYLWAAGVCLTTLLITLSSNPCLFYLGRLSQRCRISLSSLVQRKILRLSASSQQTDQGQITNLISNDTFVIEQGLMQIPYLLVAPLQLILFVGFLYVEFGWSIAAGLGFILIYMPFQYINGTKSTEYRKKIGTKTDERTRVLAEVIDAIQSVKMYAWERVFHDILKKRRKEEVKQLRKRSSLHAFQMSIFLTSSRIVPFLTFLTAVFFLGIPLTADRVFYTVAALNTLTHYMVFMLPGAIRALGEMRGSLQRLQQCLQLSEKPDNGERHSGGESGIPSILLNMASASWNPGDPCPTLSNLNCALTGNRLIMVVGKVGCGKTSFLHLLLNELHIKNSGRVTVEGTLSYAPQEPNLFPGSIRANILNSRQFHAKAYEQCLEVACLTQDIQEFKKTGDSKRVSGLSGGQKARVNLARALYHKYTNNANIFLLDDPLSAVDAGVSRQIFEGAIQEHLKDTLRILATHQVQYLKEADHVIVMDAGRIVAQGLYSDSEVESKVVELLGHQTDASVDALMASAENNPQGAVILPKSSKNTSVTIPDEDEDDEKDEEEKEEQGEGALGLNIYWKYFDAGNSRSQLFTYFLTFLISQVFTTLIEWWLALWTNAEERMYEEDRALHGNDTIVTNTTSTFEDFENFLRSLDSLEQHMYIYVYLILTTIVFLTNLAKAVAFFKYCMRISTRIHEKMLECLLRAKPSFFENNTQGRIMNRFTKDMSTIDEQIPLLFFDMWTIFLQVGTVILLIVVAIWYSVVPVIVFLLLLGYVRGYYVTTSRDLKRIDGTTRSPVISHVQATFSTLVTMRALGAEKDLSVQFDNLQDVNTSSTISFLAASQCFNIWIEILATILLTLVAFGFLLAQNYLGMNFLGGNVGLAICSAMSLTIWLQYGMKVSANVENLMISVERSLQYTKLPGEASLETKEIDKMPPEGWPIQPEVKFEKAYLSYDDKKNILENLSFRVRAGEKIGIVGQTGAGKSSVLRALFRMTELRDGRITVDGRDIKLLGLHDLRRKLVIIPQEPKLFKGTLQFNLDPTGAMSTNEMTSILQKIGLEKCLNLEIDNKGESLSFGERQLVSIARALLLKRKIVCLDEATAHIDPGTDRRIQETLRETLGPSITSITIAHRLGTVIESDRILVLGHGQMKEYDHPHQLLQNPTGFLSKMVHQTGPESEEDLRNRAKQSWHRKNPNQ